MAGHDAPIDSDDADVLFRGALADEIADLAATTPPEWSTRIGIYGAWGTGKTSLLHMVGRRLRTQGHTVAHYNPWAFDSSEAMLKGLLDAVVAADPNMQTTPGRARRVIAGILSATGKLAGAGSGLLGAAAGSLPGEAASAAGSWFDRLAQAIRADKAQLERANERPSEDRLVVLVDDLDRASPAIVPKLLFTLHELLSELPIVFVLALDPRVVSQALAAHHPAFGNGTAFLEKIIQFPRWIPEPSSDALLALALRDASRDLPFVDKKALKQEMPLLSRNPRRLRRLLRSLWPLRQQVQRHAPNELNWTLLLRLAVLRENAPDITERLIEQNDTLIAIMSAHYAQKDEKIADTLHEQALQALTKAGLAEHATQALEIGEALVSAGHGLVGPDAIAYHLSLFTHPPFFTLHEVQTIASTLLGSQHWQHTIERHGQAALLDLTLRCAEAYRAAMEGAANARLEDTCNTYLTAARQALHLAHSAITYQPGTATPIKSFSILRQSILQWAHFRRNHEYIATQQEALALLEEIAQRTTIDALDIVDDIRPWSRDHHDASNDAHAADDRTLAAAIPRATREIQAMLMRPGGALAIISGSSDAARWLMLQAATWTTELIDNLEAAAISANAISENCLHLIAFLARENHRSETPDEDRTRLLSQDGLLERIWNIATVHRVNIRMFSSLAKQRNKLEDLTQRPLPEPLWWHDVAELLQDGSE